ncbi:hypothetical protein M8J77_016708 [Diaphorina citri]|nr:hypothetical protein M8J77_016708 [Diaphorina citri]
MDPNVDEYLQVWGLGQYVQTFRDNLITFDILSQLTEDMIKELIAPIGHRAKFLSHLKELNDVVNSLTPSPEPPVPIGNIVVIQSAEESAENSISQVDLLPSDDSVFDDIAGSSSTRQSDDIVFDNIASSTRLSTRTSTQNVVSNNSESVTSIYTFGVT